MYRSELNVADGKNELHPPAQRSAQPECPDARRWYLPYRQTTKMGNIMQGRRALDNGEYGPPPMHIVHPLPERKYNQRPMNHKPCIKEIDVVGTCGKNPLPIEGNLAELETVEARLLLFLVKSVHPLLQMCAGSFSLLPGMSFLLNCLDRVTR